MKNLLLFLTILVVSSCDEGQKSNSTEVSTIENEKIPEDTLTNKVEEYESPYFDYTESVINESFSDTALRLVSNKENVDYFIINIPEGKVTETLSSLLILNQELDTIYIDTFKTRRWIYDYALEYIKNDSQLVAHIIERAQENISPESFQELNDDQSLMKYGDDPRDFVNYEAYLKARKQKLPVYNYSLDAENMTFMVYDDSLELFVPVLYCC